MMATATEAGTKETNQDSMTMPFQLGLKWAWVGPFCRCEMTGGDMPRTHGFNP
jgi:hypothetical protein